MERAIRRDVNHRAPAALRALLPSAADVRKATNDSRGLVFINGTPVRVMWIGEGWLRDVRSTLATPTHVPDRHDIAVARRMSPGARAALSAAGIGWVDETGAAEIAVGPVVVSRSGRPVRSESPKGWTPSVIGVAEALLCGTKATVEETRKATGLSIGSCTQALRLLSDEGLLSSQASRGRYSARRLVAPGELLDAYASAAAADTAGPSLQVGVTWRDPLAGLAEIGSEWDRTDTIWACTSAVAASVLAPYLTSLSSAEVYVDTGTMAGLEAVARTAGLRPIEGGRLTLRPFPTATSRRLSIVQDRLRIAPWPRVYADLRVMGIRGEEAAEHLREVMNAG